MYKRIFSLSILFICMIVYSCCEAEGDNPSNGSNSGGNNPPIVVVPTNPVKPTIKADSETTATYEVDEAAQPLKITATVTDGGTLSYKWYKSASESDTFNQVDGATSAEYTPETTEVGTFKYKCEVTNTLSGKTASAESPIFTVTVTAKEGEVMPVKPTIKADSETKATYEVGDTAKPLKITATVTDGGKLSYKWYKSASESDTFNQVDGATSAEYTPETTEVGTFKYKCEVTNTLNGKTASAESPIFTVTVTAKEGEVMPVKPTITTTSETTATYEVDEAAQPLKITATVTDGGTLSYKWYKSASESGAFELIASATSAEYTPETSEVGTFKYKCEVTNTLSGKTASAESPIFTVEVISKTGDGGFDIDFN